MALPFPDDFDSKNGRFDGWTTTQRAQGAPSSFLTEVEQQHIDFRCFYQDDIFRPRQQFEIDPLTQAIIEGPDELDPDDSPYDTMFELDYVLKLAGEKWAKTGTGFTGLSVGRLPSKSGWRGLQSSSSGAAINATFTSAIPVDSEKPPTNPVNLTEVTTAMVTDEYLSIIFGDLLPSEFDTSASYVWLTSDTGGSFGANTSNKVYFSSRETGTIGTHTVTSNELMLDMTLFDSGSPVGFDLTSVTGIEIHLEEATGFVGRDLILMAIRVITDLWEHKRIDFNTKLETLTVPVTLDGSDPIDDFVPIIRGEDNTGDATPIDGSVLTFFNTGGGGSTFEADPNHNYIDFILREISDSPNTTGNMVVVRLRWNNTETTIEAFEEDFDDPAITITNILPETDLGVILDTADDTVLVNGFGDSYIDYEQGNYLAKVDITGGTMTFELWKVDANQAIIERTIPRFTFTSGDFPYRNGRLGLYAFFIDRDAYIESFSATATAFAQFTTEKYLSNTPVDGLKMNAVYSGDKNLFREFIWIESEESFVDITKTFEGTKSYKSTTGVFTNPFLVNSFDSTYISMNIWVPSTVSVRNEPKLRLESLVGGSISIPLPPLQGATWNQIEVELKDFSGVSGLYYYLNIVPNSVDIRSGPFWIDNMKIGERSIQWKARADSTKPFRSLSRIINDNQAAMHFGMEERGKELQVQAIAVDQNGWVSSFQAMPRYASLGNFVFDESFERR